MTDQVKVLFVVIDFILMVFIILSNIASVSIILKKANKKTSKNMFLISLSLSDVAVGLFVIPNVIFLSLHNSPVSPYICQICLYTEYMASAANVFSIAALAIDRFRALAFPLKLLHYRKQIMWGSVVGVWVSCLLYGARAPLVYKGKEFTIVLNNSTITRYGCAVPDSLLTMHWGFVVFDFMVIFLLPALILIACNIAASVVLSKKSKANPSKPENANLKKKKAIRMLLLMIFIFITLNFPIHYLRMAVYVFRQRIPNASNIGHIFLILTFLNNSLNVFFYGVLSDDLKAFFLRQTSCFKCCVWKRNLINPTIKESNANTCTVQAGSSLKNM